MPPTRSSEKLLAAALELIAATGIDALTLRHVAECAGVSRATAYREFGDKDGLLSAVAQHEITRMADETFRGLPMDSDPAELVPTVIMNALDFLRSHAAFTYVRDHEPHWLLHALLLVGQTRMNLVQTVATVVAPTLGTTDATRLALAPVHAAEIVVRTVLSHSIIRESMLTDRQVAEAVTRAIISR